MTRGGTRKLKRERAGFTVVELVVVIIVIAIVAAVSIVGYGAWRTQVAQTEVKSSLQALASAMEDARTFNDAYPANVPGSFEASDGVTVTISRSESSAYCAEAVSVARPETVFYYDSLKKGEPLEGTCPELISNMLTNPMPTSATYYKPSSSSVGGVTFTTNAEGQSAVRSTRLTSAAYALYVQRDTGGIVTANTGDTYTMVYTIMASEDTTVSSLVGYGASTATLSGQNQTINLTANVPQVIRHTFTVPSGYDGQPIFPKILWGTNVGSVGAYFEVSNMMWTQGDYSGDAKNGGTQFWKWVGAENLSTSRGPEY